MPTPDSLPPAPDRTLSTEPHGLVPFGLTAAPHEALAVQLGDAIAELAARIHAATYELLFLIRHGGRAVRFRGNVAAAGV